MTTYVTLRDAFDHQGHCVKKGENITFPEGAKIPKWVVDADKFKPAMVPKEPAPADTKPAATKAAVEKKTSALRDLA